MLHNKKLISCLLLLILSLGFVGCGGADPVLDIVDLPALCDDILKGTDFEQDMVLSQEQVFLGLYGIDAADVKESYNYLTGGATSEELTVVDGVDEKAAEKIEAACKKRLEYQIDLYESYAPEEVERLNQAIVLRTGTKVLLCVAADPAPAKKIWNSTLR